MTDEYGNEVNVENHVSAIGITNDECMKVRNDNKKHIKPPTVLLAAEAHCFAACVLACAKAGFRKVP